MGDLARANRAKNGLEINNEAGLNSDTLLIIRLPDARLLRILSRSFFLAILLLALPSLSSIMRASSYALYSAGSDITGRFKILPVLFRDLVDEGLIKVGHKGFIVGAGSGYVEPDLDFLKETGIDLITESDLLRHQKKNIPTTFDFVFALNFQEIKEIYGVIKNNGIVITPLGNDPMNELHVRTNYRIVYLRKYDSTVVAMRKSGRSSSENNSPAKVISCGTTVEAKRDVLKGLEDVYLEPPRRVLAESSFRSRKIKFLPDLLKDSLESYPRRVFIADDSSALDWFYKHYPMRDQRFEIFKMELKPDESLSSSLSSASSSLALSSGMVAQETTITATTTTTTGVSNWLTKNVMDEDYVVLKAEAQVVEEMLKEKTICLVDELFLECKNQWQGGGKNGSKRAYWQCLALYGKLRDEGVAVHQW